MNTVTLSSLIPLDQIFSKENIASVNIRTWKEFTEVKALVKEFRTAYTNTLETLYKTESKITKTKDDVYGVLLEVDGDSRFFPYPSFRYITPWEAKIKESFLCVTWQSDEFNSLPEAELTRKSFTVIFETLKSLSYSYNRTATWFPKVCDF